MISLKNPLDMHLHLRDFAMLENVAPYSARDFRAAVIMPNLVPPLCDLESLKAYKMRILNSCKNENFTPLMTLFFQNYDYEFLQKARSEIFAIKLYPAGITTNSQNGVSNFDINTLTPTLEAMSELEIPLLVHGETNDFVMQREEKFGVIYEKLAKSFPKLKIVMEHISTKALCDLLDNYENLFATITLHHLELTLDDVIGGKMAPHLFCKPIAKTHEDREALRNLAFNAHKKVMFGSDSAPHPVNEKECCGCAAGVFSAPVILSVLSELFMKHSNIENLQKFISDNAANIYNFKFDNDKIINLSKSAWKVNDKFGNVVSYKSGEILEYQVLRDFKNCEFKQNLNLL